MSCHMNNASLERMIGYRTGRTDVFVGIRVGADLTVHGANHDDVADCVPAYQVIAQVAGEQEPSSGVGENTIELIRRHIGKIVRVGGVSVVHEDVDFPGRGDGVFESACDRGLVELIEFYREVAVAAFGAEFIGGSSRFLQLAAGDDHVGSRLCQGVCHRAAEPARGPGDKGCFPGEIEEFVDGWLAHSVTWTHAPVSRDFKMAIVVRSVSIPSARGQRGSDFPSR